MTEFSSGAVYINTETGNVYRVLFHAFDTTPHRAGTSFVVYETVDEKLRLVAEKEYFRKAFILMEGQKEVPNGVEETSEA